MGSLLGGNAARLEVDSQAHRASLVLFFHDARDRPGFFQHVGVYDRRGNIIHAPTTGRTVEVEPIDLTVAHPWGDTVVAGRPVCLIVSPHVIRWKPQGKASA